MVLGGLFGGVAAGATNRGLLEWRRLQEEERRARAQEDIQREQLELSRARQEWEERRQEWLNAYNAGVHSDEMDMQFIRHTLEGWDDMDLQGQLSALDFVKEMGVENPTFARYSHLLSSRISQGFSLNPQQAHAVLTQNMSAPAGEVPHTPETVRMAAEALVASFYPEYTPEQRAEWVERQVQIAQDRIASKEEFDATAYEQQRADLLETNARISNIQAQTARTEVETFATSVRIGQEVEKHELVMEQMRVQNEILRSEDFRLKWENGILDERWQLEQRETLARIIGQENQNKLFAETFDMQVSMMAAELDITESEARVAVATENAKILLAEGQYDLLQVQIDQIRQATATDQAQEEHLRGRTAMLSVEEVGLRSSILTELVASGNPELIERFAPQLLEEWADEETVQDVVASLTSIATNIRDSNMKRAAGEAAIAVAEGEYYTRTLETRVEREEALTDRAKAEADISRFTADTFMEELERKRDLEERGMRVQEGRLALDWERFHAEQSALAASQMAQNLDPIDLINDIQDATRWDPVRITEAKNEILALEQEVEMLRRLANNFSLAHPLVEKYSLGSADDAIFQANLLEETIEAKNQNIVDGVYTMFTLAASRGHVLSPKEIGLSEDSPYYERALARAGIYSIDTIKDKDGNIIVATEPLSDAVIEAEPKLRSDIKNWLSSNPDMASNLLLGEAAGLYAMAQQKYGQGVLDALGIRNPSDMEQFIQPFAQEFSQAWAGASLAQQHFGIDLNDLNQKQNTIVETQRHINALTDLRHRITNLEGTNNPDALILENQLKALLPPGVELPWSFLGTSKGQLLRTVDQAMNTWVGMQNGVIYFLHTRPPAR